MSQTDEELELSRNVRRKRKPLRAKSRDFSETSADDARALEKEVDDIRLSLDVLKDSLILQQYVLARDFEARIREVYDGVINDINDIRQRVNAIGDTFKTDTKFKKWTPLMPFRKDVLQSVYHVRPAQTSKLKGSRSVDFVDQRGREPWPGKSDEVNFDRFQSKTIFSQRQSWLGSSQSSISSTCSSRKVVPGFGCCFNGDGKTVPYRSFRAGHQPNRSHRHSWGPSRSGSRSALDEDEPEDRSCLCGSISDDWRAKVVPYMAGGWPVPGIDRSDIEKLRERIEQMETMRHDIVNVHNEYRRQHGCPDLSVTTDLAREAQQWSDILATRGYAQYSDTQDRGENILVVDIEDSLSGRQVVDTWYRESRFYNYKTPRWQRGTSNFTQMIWHSSQFIGVGIAKFPNDNTYVVVVQYQPPGNINTTGKFRLNVPVPMARKDQKRKENCASEYKPTNDSIMESQLRGVQSDCVRNTDTADIKRTNNTSECGSAKIKLEIELIDQIPDGIGIGNESFKDPPFLSNSLKETDIETVNKLQGNDNALKQKASPASSSGEWQNETVDSQSYVKEFVTGNEGIDLIDNLFAGLTEKEVDIVIAESPEDNIDDDLENSTVIASVSASQASFVCDNNMIEEWKHEI